MTTISYPILSRAYPQRFSFGLVSNTQKFSSPLTQTVQTAGLPGARWYASIGYENLTQADAAKMQAFFAQLRGMANRFTIFNFERPVTRGSAPGSPLVNGAGQTGASIVTDGWTANQNGILLAGDFFGVNGELKIVTADVNSDSGGNAVINFEPPLRDSPADNAAIITASPLVTMMLDSDSVTWSVSPAQFVSLSFNATEAFS